MINLECQLSQKRRVAAQVRLVAGGSGAGGGKMQEKTVTPSTAAQVVTPDSGFSGLSRVNVGAVTLQDKAVEPATSAQVVKADDGSMALGTVTVGAAPLQTKNMELTTAAQVVTPDAGFYGLAKVVLAGYGYPDLESVDVSQEGNVATITGTMADGSEEVIALLTVDESGQPMTLTVAGQTIDVRVGAEIYGV